MGYAARGLIYVTIGVLAFLSTLGLGGEEASSKGAILNLKEQPFGQTLLVILIIGLLGYIIWRFTQGIKDADGHGHSFKGLVVRGSLIVSAITHSILCYWTIKLLLHNTEDSSGDSASSSLSAYLGSDITAFVVGIIGLILVGVGLAHLFKGYKARFEQYMAIPQAHYHWMKKVCQFGLISRGIVWCIIGWVVLRSAFISGTSENKGISDALEWLQTTPFGSWLTMTVAIGLIAFGLYSFLEAVYRRVEH
jgi:heme/copper-type cytochrome/quinol oxidase subunit 2|tara:strand:+ start:4358 stop:5107 length:750 start_codon:yes stop_codon:yes gene_type:complete